MTAQIDQNIMATVFNVITNVLIIVSVVAMIVFIARLIFRGRGELETAVRSMAAVAGFLIYVGSQALGISIPSFMLSAISTTNPLAIGFLGILLPALAGTLVAWYCLNAIQQSEDLGARLVVLLATFIVSLFSDVYVSVLANSEILQEDINVTLLPNLTFTVGISLYVIFKYLPQTATSRER